jgi:cation transporter-like permease
MARNILLALAIAGMVLLLNGVVGLCVRNKTGTWKEGGASLLAGAIVTVASLMILAYSITYLPPG